MAHYIEITTSLKSNSLLEYTKVVCTILSNRIFYLVCKLFLLKEVRFPETTDSNTYFDRFSFGKEKTIVQFTYRNDVLVVFVNDAITIV